MKIEYDYKYAPMKDDFHGVCFPGAGGTDTEEEAEQWIEAQLKAGNKWAWCAPRVKAEVDIDGQTFRAVIEWDFCCAESEADFCNAQYIDACHEARAALLRKLVGAATRGAAAAKVLIEVACGHEEIDPFAHGL